MPRETTLAGVVDKIDSITIESLCENPEYFDSLFDLLEESAPLNGKDIDATASSLSEIIKKLAKQPKGLLGSIQVYPSWTLGKDGVSDIRDRIRDKLKALLETPLEVGQDKQASNHKIQVIHQQIMERIKRLLIIALEKKLSTAMSNGDKTFFDLFFNVRSTAELRDKLISDSAQITALWKGIHLDSIHALLRSSSPSANEANKNFYNTLRVQDLQRLFLFHGPLKELLCDGADFNLQKSSETIGKLPLDVVNSIDAYCLQIFFSIPIVFNNFSQSVNTEENKHRNVIIKRFAERLESSTTNAHPLTQDDVIIRMQEDSSRAFEEQTKFLKPNEIRALFTTKDFEGMTIFNVLSNRTSPSTRRTPEQHKKSQVQVHILFLHLLDLHYYLLEKKPIKEPNAETDYKKRTELEKEKKHYERQILNFDKFLHAVSSRFLQETHTPASSLSEGDQTPPISETPENISEILALTVDDDIKINKNFNDAEYHAKRQILFDYVSSLPTADTDALFSEAMERYAQYMETRHNRGLLPRETRFLNERILAMTSNDAKNLEKYTFVAKNNANSASSSSTAEKTTVSSLVRSFMGSLLASSRSSPQKEHPHIMGGSNNLFSIHNSPHPATAPVTYAMATAVPVSNNAQKVLVTTGTEENKTLTGASTNGVR